MPKANAYGEGWKKPSDPKYAYTPTRAIGAGVGMTGYDASTADHGAIKSAQEAELKRRHGVEQKHNKDDGPQTDRVSADRGPDKPGPAPAHAHAHHHGHMPWNKDQHQAKAGLSKEHGQDLAQGQGKPWEHRNADPDRAESRLAEQAREREQERGR
ncbi:hypothetical protein HF289_13645 [Acidithiobacillus ferrooxidans]|uniref:hypothetical protein n=1 Tax=Acidithiobacillus ferrooxidans TaxID=920 RepID=UPI001C06E828|nr:hypothetical protein [Acidithiobacillus ferrooxidans]MBU2857868.1 hypothetical protein [Acidithiobacillus ferrooxidans]